MDNPADISKLQIMHWSPRTTNPGRHGAGLFLDTCLRQMHIDLRNADAPLEFQFSDRREAPEIRSGTDAYGFILEITTGLRSAIPGETNVFGQFKNAWSNFYRDGHPAQIARLAPLIHRLINDTKAIRAEHLQGIGGSSYGSLVRRLIAPRAGDRILFVGAGQLARSMLPLFNRYELGIWNRRSVELPTDAIEHAFRPEQGRHAASWADHVILTTPADPINDRNWQRWIAAGTVRTMVHLGHRRGTNQTGWAGIRSYDLDDVFALRRKQADLRSAQLARARAACRHRARYQAAGDCKLSIGSLAKA